MRTHSGRTVTAAQRAVLLAVLALSGIALSAGGDKDQLEVAPRPTPLQVVNKMLELAEVTKDDVVYDLAMGDGRLVVEAAKRYGARARGFALDPERVKEAQREVRVQAVTGRVTLEQRDPLKVDLSEADVVALHGLAPSAARLLRPQLRKLKRGARVVADFRAALVRPQDEEEVTLADGTTRTVFLWVAPITGVKKKGDDGPPDKDKGEKKFEKKNGATKPKSDPGTTVSPVDSDKFAVVKVFYGTSRKREGGERPEPGHSGLYFWAMAAAGLTSLAGLVYARRHRRFLRDAAVFGAGATVVLVSLATIDGIRMRARTEKPGARYGSERGELEQGTCEVTIPRSHRIGQLEAPSILSFEVIEDPEKHVILRRTDPLSRDGFFAELQETVGRAPGKEALVFVHGYNVSFEDAARRTAQLAYDLKFPGAPIFYSWPSNDRLLAYTRDEANAEWAVPSLTEFLAEVQARSGASTIHLVAHSMGNRCLTAALQALPAQTQEGAGRFGELVLAAPDIDADLFKRSIAPAVAKKVRRVTLYASSRDQALVASKQVHGYPRAGDGGMGIVVVPGVDTVDVSAIETSLLGHSYYGDNNSLLADLFYLLREGKKADDRARLRRALLGGLTYWVFQP